ncbi:MAG: hypothetical protein QOI64_198 [Solirubrobacteraceae bacterium]|nr:hypothetical protein [Solirubrobacteraceae bacterium]
MYAHTLLSSPQAPDDAPPTGRPDLHALHARRVARAAAIAQAVSQIVNCGPGYPEVSAVARRPAARSRRFHRPISRTA